MLKKKLSKIMTHNKIELIRYEFFFFKKGKF